MDPKLKAYFSKMARKAAKARLQKITPEERHRIASEAAKVRWSKPKKGGK